MNWRIAVPFACCESISACCSIVRPLLFRIASFLILPQPSTTTDCFRRYCPPAQSALSMSDKTCVLTVGSTRFDPLVRAFLCPDSLDSLPALGIADVVAQVGDSALPAGFDEGSTVLPRGLRLRILRFANDLEEQVGQAHLVVSHAGASPAP